MERQQIYLTKRQIEKLPAMMKYYNIRTKAEMIRTILDKEIDSFLVDNSIELFDKVSN